MLKIGSLQLKNRLIMAPLAGITNLPFRMMVKKMGAGLVTTEMISAKGLVLGKKKTLAYLTSDIAEKPLSVQIFGAEPESMAEAARIAVERGADVIDINMGCPVKKVVKTGAGAALLRTPERIRTLVSAVRKACPVPLTAKIRSGWRPDSPDTLFLARLIEDSGADGLVLHPRFASQGYSGKADWGLIRRVKDGLRIPVIGNGDVFEPSLALKMRAETGCDGVMIGRGAVGNPWIFKQILEMEEGLTPQNPSPAERKALIMEHFHHLSRLKGERSAARIMRGLLIRYSKGLPHSSGFRGDITGIKDFDSLASTMDAFFGDLEEMES
jgi:tRNA-dihydrouridine synthase B